MSGSADGAGQHLNIGCCSDATDAGNWEGRGRRNRGLKLRHGTEEKMARPGLSVLALKV